MAGWCRCARDWETPDVQRRHRLERPNRQHALVSVESHCRELLRETATKPLQQVGTRVEDPIMADNTAMTKAERRLSAQAYFCACSDLQEEGAAGGPMSSQRFRVRSMEAAKNSSHISR